MSDAEKFLATLAPDATSFFFQALHDKDKAATPYDFTGTFAEHDSALRALNDKGYGIFVQINQNDGAGTGNDSITLFRALFTDLDGGLPPGGFALEPSMLVQSSPGKYQAYWTLKEPVAVTAESRKLYRGLLKGIITVTGGDPKCADERRILRLPGFSHHKREPFTTKLVA